MKTENVTKTAVKVVGNVVGAMGSRILADQIPLDDSRIKYGVLSLGLIVGALFLDSEDSIQCFAQDACIGGAATQLGSLVKELVAPTEGMLKTALGTPNRPRFLATPKINYNMIPRGRVRTNRVNEVPTVKRFAAS